MAEEEEEAAWLRIREPPVGVITEQQERAIREYAFEEGFETLRGFHMRLRARGWDYYDVLQIVSP